MASSMSMSKVHASTSTTSRRPAAMATSSRLAVTCTRASRSSSASHQQQQQQVQQQRVDSQVLVCRAAAAAAPAAAPPASTAQTKQEWYALVASAEFFFNDPQNESLAEQLRERVRFFKEQGRQDLDFHLVPDPKWLDQFHEQNLKVQKPCVALVSTDKNWIVFMKVRLDRVLRIDLGDMPTSEVLAVGGEVPDFSPLDRSTSWTAPYAPYAPRWWDIFIPKNNNNNNSSSSN